MNDKIKRADILHEEIKEMARDMDYACTKKDLYPSDAQEIAKVLYLLGYRKCFNNNFVNPTLFDEFVKFAKDKFNLTIVKDNVNGKEYTFEELFGTVFEDNVVISKEELEEKYEPSETFMAIARELEELKESLADKIVLSRRAYKELKHYEDEMYRLQGVVDQLTNEGWDILDEKEEKIRQLERKETAAKVIKWFKENGVCIPSDEHINEFAKQFGVEEKE